jgi:hypothetical protein
MEVAAKAERLRSWLLATPSSSSDRSSRKTDSTIISNWEGHHPADRVSIDLSKPAVPPNWRLNAGGGAKAERRVWL